MVTAAIKGQYSKKPGALCKEFSSRMDPDDEEPTPKTTEPSRGSIRTRQSKPSLLDDNDVEMEDGEGFEADLVEKTMTATSSNAQGKRPLTLSKVETTPKRARVTEKSTGAMRQFQAIGGTPSDSTSSAPATLHVVEGKRFENLSGRPLLAEGGRRATEKYMANAGPIDLSSFKYNEGDRIDYELVPALLGKVRHS